MQPIHEFLKILLKFEDLSFEVLQTQACTFPFRSKLAQPSFLKLFYLAG